MRFGRFSFVSHGASQRSRTLGSSPSLRSWPIPRPPVSPCGSVEVSTVGYYLVSMSTLTYSISHGGYTSHIEEEIGSRHKRVCRFIKLGVADNTRAVASTSIGPTVRKQAVKQTISLGIPGPSDSGATTPLTHASIRCQLGSGPAISASVSHVSRFCSLLGKMFSSWHRVRLAVRILVVCQVNPTRWCLLRSGRFQ